MWSRRNPLWRKYSVRKPRMPDTSPVLHPVKNMSKNPFLFIAHNLSYYPPYQASSDNPANGLLWDSKHYPASLDSFASDQNTATTSFLQNLVATRKMRNLIIQVSECVIHVYHGMFHRSSAPALYRKMVHMIVKISQQKL